MIVTPNDLIDHHHLFIETAMDIQEETMIQMNIQNEHPEFSRDRVAAEFHGAYVLVEGVYVCLLPQVVQLHPRVLARRDQLRTTRFVSGNG